MNEEMQCIDKKLYKELITIQKTLNNFGLHPTKTFIQRLDGTLFNLFKAKTKSTMDIKLKEASAGTLIFKYNK